MTLRLLILGATSGIGRSATHEALSRGHRVRAFGRSADALEAKPHLEPFVGDALIAEDVSQALDGVDVVIYALGIKESLATLSQEVTLFSQSTEILLNQMQKLGPKRLIAVTGFGAGRSQTAMSRVERLGHRALLGRPYSDKDLQEDLIMQSDLDWTIVRPTILTNTARTGKYRVLREQSDWRNGLISRADVAHYLVDIAAATDDIRADVVLAR